MIKFYLTPYEYYPWDRNTQYQIECKSWAEARRFAKILSAFLGAYIRIDDSPGYKKEGELIGGVMKVEDEKLKSVK